MLTNGFHEVPTGKLAMVVTHLEMRTRADTRPVPTPDGIELHPSKTSQLMNIAIFTAALGRTGFGSRASI